MSAARALIADSDAVRRSTLAATLAGAGCHVVDVPRLATVVIGSDRCRPDLVVVAFSAAEAGEVMPEVDRLRHADRRLPIVLVVADSSEALAVAALRAGVKDYFPYPFDHAALAATARRCLAARRAHRAEVVPVRQGEGVECPFVGKSESMQRVYRYLLTVAQNDSTVLITGETGTGKELAATLIHDRSPRRKGRFVTVNCAAIPDGLLENELFGHESGAFTGASGAREGILQSADHGTVFLDEVGEMGPQAQAKLLRAIETREVYPLGGKRPVRLDIRVVAATNQDLERAVEEGRFRKDLYFRLNVARVHLPPLRERRSDIASLLDHCLRDLNRRYVVRVDGFTEGAMDALKAYDWPGNVRELKNLVEAILAASPPVRVDLDNLPESFRQRLRAVCSLPEAERRRLMETLLATNWNKSRTAELLHWSRMTVYRKMAKYSLAQRSDRAVLRAGGGQGPRPLEQGLLADGDR